MYDITIIGGDPSGATLARLIGKKYKVLLLEKRRFEEPLYKGFQKCCGGLLDPDAQKMLAQFGLGLPKSVIVSPQMFTVRTIDIDNSQERFYQRHYVNIDREEFDRWLLSLIYGSVDIVKDGIFTSHEELDDHIKIIYTKAQQKHQVKAKLLIGADGANSKVSQTAFKRKPCPDTYIAIQEWFENTQNINYYGQFLIVILLIFIHGLSQKSIF